MGSRIIVVTHKKYRMPEDKVYFPVLVGNGPAREKLKAECPDYGNDDEGDNISSKNKNYCELTALYWAWKNLDADALGLVHYRRHFTARKKGDKWDSILTGRELNHLLKKTGIILPKKRNYYIETNYSQYAHAHHAVDLDTARDIISEKYPEYIKAFDQSMKQRTGHRFNMFIMKKKYLDEYCEWLFDILFELEKRLDISDYNENDSRVFGFVSERLLDVWIGTKGYDYLELPYMFMEKQNWLIKGSKFLKRKFIRKGR